MGFVASGRRLIPGTLGVRVIVGYRWLTVMPQLFDGGLLTLAHEHPRHSDHLSTHDVAWRYERLADALKDLREWDGRNEPPGPWVKRYGDGPIGPYTRWFTRAV